MPKYAVTAARGAQIQQFDIVADDGWDALLKAAQWYKDDRQKEGDYSSLFVSFKIVRYPD
jgi:hypothetical protein